MPIVINNFTLNNRTPSSLPQISFPSKNKNKFIFVKYLFHVFFVRKYKTLINQHRLIIYLCAKEIIVTLNLANKYYYFQSPLV
jgi:hypothetical protein